MENDKPNNLEYKGDGPRWAALKTFVASTAAWVVGFKVVGGLLSRRFTSFKPSEIDIGLATAFATFDGYHAYKKTSAAVQQHDTLVTDNIAMRTQLNQTGQILRHVAGEIEKGKMPESQLMVTDDAPPTHVTRLEAQNAATAAQTAMQKL